MLIVTIDVHRNLPLSFICDKGSYRIDGQCLRCGKCCVDCPMETKDSEGLSVCLDEQGKPWDCKLFPATRDPSNPLPKECGFKIIKVK